MVVGEKGWARGGGGPCRRPPAGGCAAVQPPKAALGTALTAMIELV